MHMFFGTLFAALVVALAYALLKAGAFKKADVRKTVLTRPMFLAKVRTLRPEEIQVSLSAAANVAKGLGEEYELGFSHNGTFFFTKHSLGRVNASNSSVEKAVARTSALLNRALHNRKRHGRAFVANPATLLG